MVECKKDIYMLYEKMDAPTRLRDHVKHAGSVADELTEKLKEIGLTLDENLVRLGAACHDAG